jgi:hypothetical protein
VDPESANPRQNEPSNDELQISSREVLIILQQRAQQDKELALHLEVATYQAAFNTLRGSD